MGTFDISRINFDPIKHFKSVRMQQGRVLTDDDWNENERIKNEELRRSIIDIIGPYGSPDEGFKIDGIPASVNNPKVRIDNEGEIDFVIKAGTLYLGGLKLELEEDETYRLQNDWLQQPSESYEVPKFTENENINERYDLVYIEAWQQEVSAVEDSSLLETALGGPDTTTRVRNMRRVKLLPDIGSDNCEKAWNNFIERTCKEGLGRIKEEYESITDAKLNVTFSNSVLTENPCTPDAAGGYLGAENQAIRVQIVDNNNFTWGFDNASPLYRVTVDSDRETVHMVTEPKDQYHWPLSGQVIEILPWSAVLSNGQKVAEQIGHLSKVKDSFNQETGNLDKGIFTLLNPLPTDFCGLNWEKRSDNKNLLTDGDLPIEYFYMRVWDRGNCESPYPQIGFSNGTAVELGNTGLEITFKGTEFIEADYWVIAARPETPNKVVPWELESEEGISRHGVRRFYAPLAIIRWSKSDSVVVTGEILHDCRKKFNPLTKPSDSLTIKEETCIIAIPDEPGWERIFENLDNGQDICVCFKNGVYKLNSTVRLEKKGNIKFTGCGKGSRIIVQNKEVAFEITDCRDVLIRDLSINNKFTKPQLQNETHLNGTVNITRCENILLENITVSCMNDGIHTIRQNTCITINAKEKPREAKESPPIFDKVAIPTSVVIRNCQFMVGDMQTALLIIDTAKSILEGNSIISPTNKIGNQGIVIAGTNPKNIHIKENVINGVLQGIHIGTSVDKKNTDGKKKVKERITADSVIISGNSIDCMLNGQDKKERHGIFVGNCDSLVIRDNFVKVSKKNGINEKWPPTNGIRVYGNFGKRIIIKDNHLDGYGFSTNKMFRKQPIKNYGIFIHYLNSPTFPWQWILEANVTEEIKIEGEGNGNEKFFSTSEMKLFP